MISELVGIFSNSVILPEASYSTIQRVNNNSTDQTALMHRLVCAFVVSLHQNQVFQHMSLCCSQMDTYKKACVW